MVYAEVKNCHNFEHDYRSYTSSFWPMNYKCLILSSYKQYSMYICISALIMWELLCVVV